MYAYRHACVHTHIDVHTLHSAPLHDNTLHYKMFPSQSSQVKVPVYNAKVGSLTHCIGRQSQVTVRSSAIIVYMSRITVCSLQSTLYRPEFRASGSHFTAYGAAVTAHNPHVTFFSVQVPELCETKKPAISPCSSTS